jgi:hypothetical protein
MSWSFVLVDKSRNAFQRCFEFLVGPGSDPEDEHAGSDDPDQVDSQLQRRQPGDPPFSVCCRNHRETGGRNRGDGDEHSDSETVRAGVFGFPDRYRMETRECWCREFPVFLTLTPIDDRVSFLGFVGSWEPPVRRYASPSG